MESARHIDNLGGAADIASDEERRESQILDSLAALSRGLENCGAEYCVLHGWQASEVAQGDFDLAIEPARLKTVEHILEHECSARIVQLLQHEATGFFFVAECEGFGGFALVDAATDYRRDGRIYMSAAEMLSGTQMRGGLRTAAAATEFKYLLIKKISKLSIPAYQRDRLRELNDVLGARGGQVVNELLGRDEGEKVQAWINQRRWSDLDRNLPRLRQLVLRKAFRQSPLNWLRYQTFELRRQWRRWRNPTGLFVAVLGPDGAGKSTLIENLLTHLDPAFRKTESFHLRPAPFGDRSDGLPITDPHGLAPRSAGSSVAKIAYYVAEYALGYGLRIRPALARTTLILADRYFDDLLIDPRRYRYGGPRWLLRGARCLVPRPDLWFVLDVPEKSLLERKCEVSVEEQRRQRRAYRQLGATLPNAFILDGSGSADQVGRAAAELCLDHLHSRYRARREIWFRTAAEDDLNWLASIIFRPSNAHLEVGRNRPRAPRDSSREFRFLRLRDGRGFLLPGDEPLQSIALGLYNAHSVKGRAAKSALDLLARTRLTRFVLPRVSISEEHAVALEDRQPSVLDRICNLVGNPALKFAISLGTPGPHRKPVIQVLKDGGQIIGYAKVGADRGTNDLVRNEAATLAWLNEQELPFEVPKLIAADESGDNFLCIQSAEQDGLATASNSFDKEFFAALIGLSRIDSKKTVLGTSRFWVDLKRRLERVRHPHYHQILERASRWLTTHWTAQSLRFHAAHGDFAPWNARLLSGQLYLFDWEYADRERPAGWDLFHFFVQTSALLRGYSALQILRDFDESGEFGHWAARYADQVGITRSSLRPMLLLYLMRQLTDQADVKNSDQQQVRRLANLILLMLANLEAGQ